MGLEEKEAEACWEEKWDSILGLGGLAETRQESGIGNLKVTWPDDVDGIWNRETRGDVAG